MVTTSSHPIPSTSRPPIKTPTDTGPNSAVIGPYSAVTGPSTAVPLAVLDEFSVGVTDTEDSPAARESATARCRRSQFGGSRRSPRPVTTSNGPVSPPPPGPGPPSHDAVVVDMNSNDKDDEAASRYGGWDRTLDDDEDVGDDIGSYDADDAMLEFAERYFNAHPAQFSQSALARTVNIVTRKSLNVSIITTHTLARPHRSDI